MAAALCLVIQVIEGALFVPFVLVYLGFPQVGLQEICRELYNLTYQDDDRECRYPYPLFFRDFTPEPRSSGEQGARLRARDATPSPLRRPRLARDDLHRRSTPGGRGEPGGVEHE